MSSHGQQGQSATAAKLKKKQQQTVSIPKSSIKARGGFVDSTQNLPLHTEIEILGKTIIVPTIIKSNPKTSQILRDFRKGVKDRQNIEDKTKNQSVTIPKRDILVVGQVFRNDNFKTSSINSIKKEQSNHIKELHDCPNGTNPILEKIIVQNNCHNPQTTNQHYTKNTQDQLFPQLEITNVAKQKTSTNTFQKSEIRNYHQNGVNLKNSQINSSLQDGVNNQELGRYYSLQKTPTLSSALKFHHKKDLYQHQKQQKIQQFPQNNLQAPPTEKLEMIKSLYKFRNNFQKKKMADIPIYPGHRNPLLQHGHLASHMHWATGRYGQAAKDLTSRHQPQKQPVSYQGKASPTRHAHQ